MSIRVGPFIVDNSISQNVLFDQVNDVVCFVGEARTTSDLTSQAVWRIGRAVKGNDGDFTIEWADEGCYTQIWDNRLTTNFITNLGTIVPDPVLANTGITTTIDIPDTATLIPTTNFGRRGSVSVHNTDGALTLFVGFNNTVTADNVLGTTSGEEIGPGDKLVFDAGDDITLFGISVAASTIRVKITELRTGE